ncbi:hypothetical protein ACERIT_09075 [Halopenitus sp. H-Gu1]|uniref:DUF7346 family protein n=1 Tax=Halopenitus sp. H-Gu1 TaxID=3242697 RepID=UPI00359D40D5
MKTVRDGSGRHYLLVKRSSDSSRVRDPRTGTERYLPTADLEIVDGQSALETAATAVDPDVRRLVTAVHDDRGIGLLVEFVDRGPIPVVELLDADDYCESDLHGLLTELRAAGLLVEADVGGQRGYDATESCERAVAQLRESEPR